MEHRRLGRSGLLVSAVGLGTNNFGGRTDEAQSIRVIDQAIDSDVTFIDTANVYNNGMSEQIIGKALKGKRQRVVLTTKFGMGMGKGPYDSGGSRKHMMEQAEASLKRLQTDYLDLYQFHRPDPNTPIEETLRGFDDLVRQGKARYIGTSNFAAWQICEASWTAKTERLTPFISEQPYYNLLRRGVEKDVVPVCKAYGIGVIPYFPLESGMLTGKYRRGEAPAKDTRLAKMAAMGARALTDRNFDIVEKLETLSREHGHTVGELAIAWLLADSIVGSVIAGATRPEQVVQNAKGADWKLTPDDLKAIDAIAPA